MSFHEEQQLLLRHERPRKDSTPMPSTSTDSLDDDLVQSFLRAVRAGTTVFATRLDAEVLLDLNVLTESGETTLAGLYALGRYPQKQFPELSITAAITGEEDEEDGVRASDRLMIAGPLPRMLTDAVAWVSRAMRTSIHFGDDSHGRNVQSRAQQADHARGRGQIGRAHV